MPHPNPSPSDKDLHAHYSAQSDWHIVVIDEFDDRDRSKPGVWRTITNLFMTSETKALALIEAINNLA